MDLLGASKACRYTSPELVMLLDGSAVDVIDITESDAKIRVKSTDNLSNEGVCIIYFVNVNLEFKYKIQEVFDSSEIIIKFWCENNNNESLLFLLKTHANKADYVGNCNADDYVEKRSAFRVYSPKIQILIDKQNVKLKDISCLSAAVQNYAGKVNEEGICIVKVNDETFKLHFRYTLMKDHYKVLRFIHRNGSGMRLLKALKKIQFFSGS